MKRNLLLLLVATLFATISLPAYVVLISTILSLHSLIFIENIIMSSASFNGVRNILTGRVNHLLEPNAELKINAIRSFFESYE